MNREDLAELQAAAKEAGMSLQDYLAECMRMMGLREVAPGQFLMPEKLPVFHPEGGVLKAPVYGNDKKAQP